MNPNHVILTLSIIMKIRVSQTAGDKSTNIYFKTAYARALLMRILANPLTESCP